MTTTAPCATCRATRARLDRLEVELAIARWVLTALCEHAGLPRLAALLVAVSEEDAEQEASA